MICSLFHIGIDDIIELDADTDAPNDTQVLLRDLTLSLSNLSYSQLLIVKKFLEEIVIYVK